MAQAALGAMHTIAEDRIIHSLHGYFLRPGDIEEEPGEEPVVLVVVGKVEVEDVIGLPLEAPGRAQPQALPNLSTPVVELHR